MSRRDLVRKASKADLKNTGNEPADGNIAAAKRAKANVQQWSMQQLMFWLESNKMKWLKPIYKEGDDSVKKYIREDTKMFQKRQDKNNEVLLKGGPAEKMIAFTTLPEDATLRVIWSEGDDYLTDFLMTFYGFSTPAQLLEVLKSRYTFVAKAEPDSDGEDDDDEGPAEVQTTVNVLKAWIDAEQGIDFELDDTLAKKFDEAVDTFSKEHSKELKKHLKKTLKEKGEKKKPAAKESAEEKGEGKKRRRRGGGGKKTAGAGEEKKVLSEADKYDKDGVELCRNFRNNGKCRFGESCTYSHAPGGPIGTPAGAGAKKAADKPKKEVGQCHLFEENGECKFGDSCRYKHGDKDTRDFSKPRARAPKDMTCREFAEKGECSYGTDCRFTH